MPNLPKKSPPHVLASLGIQNTVQAVLQKALHPSEGQSKSDLSEARTSCAPAPSKPAPDAEEALPSELPASTSEQAALFPSERPASLASPSSPSSSGITLVSLPPSAGKPLLTARSVYPKTASYQIEPPKRDDHPRLWDLSSPSEESEGLPKRWRETLSSDEDDFHPFAEPESPEPPTSRFSSKSPEMLRVFEAEDIEEIEDSASSNVPPLSFPSSLSPKAEGSEVHKMPTPSALDLDTPTLKVATFAPSALSIPPLPVASLKPSSATTEPSSAPAEPSSAPAEPSSATAELSSATAEGSDEKPRKRRVVTKLISSNPPPVSLIPQSDLQRWFQGCEICHYDGLVSFAKGIFAEIRLCSCQGEVCPKCKGEGGTYRLLPSGNSAWKPCVCLKRQRRMEVFRKAQIPARFAEKTLAEYTPLDPTQHHVKERMMRLLYDPASQRPFQAGDRGIVLMGSSGLGKTHLMIGFLRTLILHLGFSAIFQDYGVLLARLRDSYSREIPEMEILDPLIQIEILVIDDLGKGRNNKWEQNVLDTLLSCRYNAGRTTLITTNYTDAPETTLREKARIRGPLESEEIVSRETLYDRVGERIYSRLREMCAFFYLKGPDYRQRLMP